MKDTPANNIQIDFNPFAGPEIILSIPSTESQLEIWLSCKLGGDDANRAFNESLSLRLKGQLDKTAFEKALFALNLRHQSLRSAFSFDGSHMLVFKDVNLNYSFEDLTHIDPNNREVKIKDYTRDDSLLVFNLSDGPLYKYGLLKLSDNEFYFTITAHHIVCDGWSIGIILQDLSKLYSAIVQGIDPQLPEADLFSKYALDQFKFVKSEEYQSNVNYWVNQFHTVPELNLPMDNERLNPRTVNSSRFDYLLDHELVLSIKKIGIKEGCSLVNTLLAAFEIFLFQLTGQKDIVVGLPAADQSASGQYNLVGHCVNLLPLRSTHNPSNNFLEYLKDRRLAILDAYDHQQFTFGSLLKNLKLKRDPSRVPLIPVIFNIDMDMDEGVDFKGLHYDLYSNPKAFRNFELSLNIWGSEKLIQLEWSYNAHLFRKERIEGMMEGFNNLLKAIASDPLRKIETIISNNDISSDKQYHEGNHKHLKINNEQIHLSGQENNKLLNDFNATATKFPEISSVLDSFEGQVLRTPDNLALVFHDTQLTYKELNEKSNRLANYLLQQYEIKPNDLIAIKLERSEWMVIAILGILKSGAAYLPLDQKYPQERINYVLTDSGCNVLIDDNELNKYRNLEQVYDKDNLIKVNKPDDLVYVIYTSGSTGQPKGVMIEHASLLNYIFAMRDEYGITEQDKIIQISNISFDASIEQIMLGIIFGASLYIFNDFLSSGNDELAAYIEKNKITHLHAVPTLLKQLDFTKITSLKRIISAGENCPLSLAEKLKGKVAFYNKYGPTEATISATIFNVSSYGHSLGQSVPIGHPIANTQIYITDENGEILPIGIIGEICISGAGVARGYINNPVLTSEKFISNQFNDGAIMYRTGDLGRWLQDGNIEFMGRKDYQVKVRGYRIELGEIENMLLQYPCLQGAVVIAKEDAWGDKNLVAYIVSKNKVNNTVLRNYLNEKLPHYMVPSLFIQIDELPYTSNGKTDRDNLSKRIVINNQELKPDELPSSPEEKLVSKIWCDLLGMESINRTDDFFELGGHSLIAIKVIIRLENETGFKLPMSSLFEYPTIEKIAKLITHKEKLNKWRSLVPIKPSGKKVPLYLVHGGGLGVLVFNNISNYLDPEQPTYGLQALGLDGKDEPLSTVEEMADFYISEILEQNPSGPYAIAGHSAGGIIAFEMAKQLREKDKQVQYLAIFDYDYLEIERQKSLRKKIKRKTIGFFPELLFYAKSFVKRPEKTLNHQKLIWKLRYVTMLKRFGFENKIELQGIYLHIRTAMTRFEDALKKYKMIPYDGMIDLFISEDKVYYQDDPEYLGWKPFTLKEIHINKVRGNHDEMILPPNDKDFARILQKRLDDCQKSF